MFSDNTTNQDELVLKATQDGGFVGVALINRTDVMLQRYSHTGRKLGAAIKVNTVNTSVIVENKQFDVIELNNRRLVVTWSSTGGQDSHGLSVMARMLTADGMAVTDEILVNQFKSNDQNSVRLTPTRFGGFVAVYQSYGADGDGWAVMAREFDQYGVAVSEEYPITGTTTAGQYQPDITRLTSGQILVTFIDQSDGVRRTRVVPLNLPSPTDDVLEGDEQHNVLRGGAGYNTIRGNGGNDIIYDGTVAFGGEGNDTFYRSNTIHGDAGDDIFYGGEFINGGEGNDRLILKGYSMDYSIADDGNGKTIVTDLRFNGPDGTIQLQGVESIQFADTTVNL